MRASILAILILGGIVLNIKAQFSYNEKGQAIPPASQPFGKEAFESTGHTVIRWLGNAGFLINSRGTCLMVITVFLLVRKCLLYAGNIILHSTWIL